MSYISILANEHAASELSVLSHSDWERMAKSDKVITQFRWLYLNNGTKVIQRKAEMIIYGVSPGQVAAVIRDYKLAPEWMNAVSETRLISHVDKNFWVIFLTFKLPWPLSNKYLINEVRERKHTLLPAYFFEINSSDNYEPPFDCKINDFGLYEGKWKVLSLEKNITYVEFSAFSIAPPQFPRWIQDPIVNRSFTKTMGNFYTLLKPTN